jgi:AcrR family transcriptional regulator
VGTTGGLRERRNARTREAITRAALELALEDGLASTTVGRIADRAEVSPRTVHAWFGSKEDIVVAGSELPIDRLGEQLRTGEGDVLDRLVAWLADEEDRRTTPDELELMRHRLLASDEHLQHLRRSRERAAERLIAEAVASDVALPPDAAGPRALASAIVTALLIMRERHLAEDEEPEGLEPVLPMLRAALAALTDRDTHRA